MKENICKFSSPSLPEVLTVSCFVLESDSATMATKRHLSCHYMILVSSGEGEFVFDGYPVSYRAGSLLFGLCGEEMEVREREKTSYLYIAYEGERAEALLGRFGIGRVNRIFDGFDGLLPLWSESLGRASDKTVDLAAESILLYTFSRLAGSFSPKNGLVEEMVRLSERHFADPKLSITSIAKELFYNPKYLSRIFKERMGVGYSEYLRSLRLRYAISLFDRGLDSVKNVALLSGFPDPLYFSGVFKKSLGSSPREYILSRTQTEKPKQTDTEGRT